MNVNRPVIRQWVNDLRSGEFEQGMGTLECNGKFCCLGVLASQAVKAGVCERFGVRFDVQYGTAGWAQGGTLAPAICDWAGVDSNPRVGANPLVGDEGTGLTDYNDVRGYTFAQIADLIEAEWLSEDE